MTSNIETIAVDAPIAALAPHFRQGLRRGSGRRRRASSASSPASICSTTSGDGRTDDGGDNVTRGPGPFDPRHSRPTEARRGDRRRHHADLRDVDLRPVVAWREHRLGIFPLGQSDPRGVRGRARRDGGRRGGLRLRFRAGSAIGRARAYRPRRACRRLQRPLRRQLAAVPSRARAFGGTEGQPRRRRRPRRGRGGADARRRG